MFFKKYFAKQWAEEILRRQEMIQNEQKPDSPDRAFYLYISEKHGCTFQTWGYHTTENSPGFNALYRNVAIQLIETLSLNLPTIIEYNTVENAGEFYKELAHLFPKKQFLTSDHEMLILGTGCEADLLHALYKHRENALTIYGFHPSNWTEPAGDIESFKKMKDLSIAIVSFFPETFDANAVNFHVDPSYLSSQEVVEKIRHICRQNGKELIIQ